MKPGTYKGVAYTAKVCLHEVCSKCKERIIDEYRDRLNDTGLGEEKEWNWPSMGDMKRIAQTLMCALGLRTRRR